jgi:hypothetical protein
MCILVSIGTLIVTSISAVLILDSLEYLTPDLP